MRPAIAMWARNGSLGGGGPSLLWACWPPWLAPGAPRRPTSAIEATGRADVIVFATLLGIFGADYSPVRDLPEVETPGSSPSPPWGLDGLRSASWP